MSLAGSGAVAMEGGGGAPSMAMPCSKLPPPPRLQRRRRSCRAAHGNPVQSCAKAGGAKLPTQAPEVAPDFGAPPMWQNLGLGRAELPLGSLFGEPPPKLKRAEEWSQGEGHFVHLFQSKW